MEGVSFLLKESMDVLLLQCFWISSERAIWTWSSASLDGHQEELKTSAQRSSSTHGLITIRQIPCTPRMVMAPKPRLGCTPSPQLIEGEASVVPLMELHLHSK
jgi:hypothetical protein